MANTPYGWTYTPADPANYKPLTGSITPYVVTYYVGGGSYTPSYSVTVEKTANGTINVSHKNAISGETVTITAKPDAGYELSRLIVLDNKNSEQVLTAGLGVPRALDVTSQVVGNYLFSLGVRKVKENVERGRGI